MASNNTSSLDPGFEPVNDAGNSQLDEGFSPVQLSPAEKDAVTNYISKPPTATSGQALREGFAQGGTFGFAPRLGAALGAGLEKGAGTLNMGPQAANVAAGQQPQSLQDLYNEYLNYNNKLQQNAEESHPNLYFGSMIAGGIASPLNKVGTLGLGGKTAEAANTAEKAIQAGQQIQGASMPLKTLLSVLGGAKAGAIGGLSQSQNLGDVKQDIEQAGKGGVLGIGIGAMAPSVMAGLKLGAGTAAGGLESFFGPVPKTAGEGFYAGLEGEPNLATQTGQTASTEQRTDFATNFVNQLRDIIKGNAKNKIQLIQQHAADLPKDQVDNVLNNILEMDPSKMGSKEAEEFGQIKEEILRAKEGPMTTQTVRQYNPGKAPAPVLNPNQQYRPPVNGPGEVLPPQGAPQGAPAAPPSDQDVTPSPPQQLGPGGLQNLPTPAPPVEQSQAQSMGPAPEPTPSGFAGYEAVHKATIDKGDTDALNAFQQKVQEKLLDEESLGQNDNPNPVQFEQQPIPGTDKIRLIAKRAVNEIVDNSAEQAQQLAQKQKEQQRLQNLLDQQNQQAMQQKQQQEIEMAQPQFQDIQQDVRTGGRNIQSPQELYQLQQLMQEYGNPSAPRLQTNQMQQVAKNASQQLSNILKQNVGTSMNDNVLHAFNNIGEVLNIDPHQLQLPGGSGEAASEDALSKVFQMINPQNMSDDQVVNNRMMNYIGQQLNVISPELSNQFMDSVQKQIQAKGLIKEFTKPYEPTGINMLLNVTRKNAQKLGYSAGYGLGQQVQRVGAEVGPAIQAGQKIFNRYAPESLQNAATKAMQSGDQTVQQLGQVLSKLSTTDERTRNSMIFVLEQQAGYKAMMDKLMGEEPSQTPQAKDVTLQKFK